MIDRGDMGQMGRKKNAARNLIYGGIDKIYLTLIPFVRRTVILYFLGVEYLGLSSLFTSILQVLSLAELGVGNAMVYSMYKPFAENDQKTLCALLKLYKYYYRIIGFVILVLGLLVMPFLPRLIYDGVPEDINLFVLYLLNLFSTVVSYWLFAYRGSLLTASQRSDIPSKILLGTRTICYALELVAICVFRSYYLFLVISVLFQIANNLLIAAASKKLYPLIVPEGDLEHGKKKEISQRVKDLFLQKIGTTIINSSDSIVISAFLGLTWIAIYQNYNYVMLVIDGTLAIFFQSCLAGIGNSLVTESEKKNYHDLELMTFMTLWVAGFCTCCLLALYQPFMTIWVGKDMMLGYGVVICFCVYFFIHQIDSVLDTYKNAAGIWHADRFRPLLTAACNLLMNVLTIRYWGIYGVILSTVFSLLLISTPWLTHNLFSTVFEKKYLGTYVNKLLSEIFRVAVICILCTLVCSRVTGNVYVVLIVRLLICLILSNLMLFICFRKDKDFQEVKNMVYSMLKREV
jgi:O-antigen/teichoic acid export membrane protein